MNTHPRRPRQPLLTHFARQNQEFKAGVWGDVRRKRLIMSEYATRDQYILNLSSNVSAKAGDTRRRNQMERVRVGDRLHMKDNMKHYTGVVTSSFTNLPCSSFLTGWRNVALIIDRSSHQEPVMGRPHTHGSPRGSGTDRPMSDALGDRVMICDVEWTEVPLTDGDKSWLAGHAPGGSHTGTLILLAAR